jgi:hypothetical protein
MPAVSPPLTVRSMLCDFRNTADGRALENSNRSPSLLFCGVVVVTQDEEDAQQDEQGSQNVA